MLWWKDIWWWSLESVQYFLHASCMSHTAVVILIHRVIAHTCANTWVLEPTLFMAITVSQIQHSWHSCWCHRRKKKFQQPQVFFMPPSSSFVYGVTHIPSLHSETINLEPLPLRWLKEAVLEVCTRKVCHIQYCTDTVCCCVSTAASVSFSFSCLHSLFLCVRLVDCQN